MENIDFTTIAAAIGTAVYAALGLDYLTVAKLGWSLQTVCGSSLAAAFLISVFIAIKYYSGTMKNAE